MMRLTLVVAVVVVGVLFIAHTTADTNAMTARSTAVVERTHIVAEEHLVASHQPQTISGSFGAKSTQDIRIDVPTALVNWDWAILSIEVTSGPSEFMRLELYPANDPDDIVEFPVDQLLYRTNLRVTTEPINLEQPAGEWWIELSGCACSDKTIVNWHLTAVVIPWSERKLNLHPRIIDGFTTQGQWTYYSFDVYDPYDPLWTRTQCDDGDRFWKERLPTWFAISISSVSDVGSEQRPDLKAFLLNGDLPTEKRYDVQSPAGSWYSDKFTITNQGALLWKTGRWYLGILGCENCDGDWDEGAKITLEVSVFPMTSLGIDPTAGFSSRKGTLEGSQYHHYYADINTQVQLVKIFAVTTNAGQVSVMISPDAPPHANFYAARSGFGADVSTTYAPARDGASLFGRFWFGVQACYQCGGLEPSDATAYTATFQFS